jgi:hypothetical protein
MNRVMKKGAYMVFETGNLGDVDPAYFQYIDRFQYPDHLFFFGVKNLEQLLAKTGFEQVGLYRFSLMPQLRLARAIARLKEHLPGNSAHPSREHGSGRPSISAAEKHRKSSLDGFVEPLMAFRINVMEYLYFQLRYKLSKLRVRRDRPQTLILLARKVSDLPG